MFEKLRLKRRGRSGQGVVTAAKKNGGERGPDGVPTSVDYDVTVKARFEDGGEFERDFNIGNALVGTSLSFGAGDVVPILYDPEDHSRFIVDEREMVDQQKAWLDRKKREADEFDRRAVQEAEKDPPLN